MLASMMTAWTQLMQAGLGLLETGIKTGETMVAANTVVGKRLEVIAAAAQDPVNADLVELGRMGHEKVVAFSQAGGALLGHWAEMQREAAEYFMHVGTMMCSGGNMFELAERSSHHAIRSITRSIDAGSHALAPIHARATANARRLSRKAARQRKR